MKSVLVIFNGIKFPYYVIEYAIAQAKQQSALLHALFLKAKKDTDEGYGFPSDLNAAESLTDSEDATNDDEKIIKDHMKLAKDLAEAENVSCTTELLTDSSLSEINKLVNKFDLVFLDAAFDDDTPSMLTNTNFTLKELMEQSTTAIQPVTTD